jgi:hypothetical protein
MRGVEMGTGLKSGGQERRRLSALSWPSPGHRTLIAFPAPLFHAVNEAHPASKAANPAPIDALRGG